MCVKPIPIRDPKTRKVHLVPCGKCIECRRAYQNEWIFRLNEEMKHSPLPLFLTLTYDDEHLPLGDNGDVTQSVLVKSDIQLFLKRLRKNNTLGKFRYFCVGEYGTKSTLRAHWHMVIMPRDFHLVSEANQVIEQCWQNGFVKVKLCTPKQVHYVCKYMNKLDARKHLVPPCRMYSKHLGLSFLTAAMIKYYLTTFSRTCVNGSCNIPLPRYFKRYLDECVLGDPILKKLGLKYSEVCELVEPIIPERGSRYEWFRTFQQKLQNLDDMQYEMFECGWPLSLPNLHVTFDRFFNAVPELLNMKYESDRKIEECKIKNGLKKCVPAHSFDANVNFLIIGET